MELFTTETLDYKPVDVELGAFRSISYGAADTLSSVTAISLCCFITPFGVDFIRSCFLTRSY